MGNFCQQVPKLLGSYTWVFTVFIRLFGKNPDGIVLELLNISVFTGFATPTRSSPRLQNTDDYTFNIYVTAGVKPASTAEGPVYTIHDVSSQANLNAIKKLIRQQIPDVCIKAGLFWLPKKGKQCHTLCTDVDLNTAKDEYSQGGTVKNLRLAVATISSKPLSSVFISTIMVIL